MYPNSGKVEQIDYKLLAINSRCFNINNNLQEDWALEFEAETFEKLLEVSEAGIAVLNESGVVESINEGFTKLFQFTSNNVVGLRLDEILFEAPGEENTIQFKSLLLDSWNNKRKGRILCHDWSSVHVSIIKLRTISKDRESCLRALYFDRTERVAALENVIRNQVKFRLLNDTSNDAVVLFKSGFLIDCNQQALDLFNCNKEDLIGRSVLDLSPKEQPSGISSLKIALQYEQAMRDEDAPEMEWLCQRPDYSHFLAKVRLNKTDDEEVSYLSVVIRDTNGTKQTGMMQGKPSEFIAFLDDVSKDLIHRQEPSIDDYIDNLLSFAASFSDCKRAVVYITGARKEKLTAAYKWNADESSPVSALDQLLLSDLTGEYTRIMEGRIVVREVRKTGLQPEDALINEILDLSPFSSYVLLPLIIAGKFLGMAGFISKNPVESWNETLVNPLRITSQLIAIAIERQQLEQELRETKEKAVESDKLKTAFLSSLSHEIRTPMNHILGFIELLKDPSLSDGEKAEFMSIIKSSGNLLLKLIDDIIDIAKLESGQLVINQVDLQLGKFLEDLDTSFSAQLKTISDGKIEFIIAKPVIPIADSIKTDPLRLKQIVTNLLSNALKFTQEGRITFGYTLKKDKKLHFFIEDTGIGIPAEMHQEVFERFRQLDGSYAREFSGTGLGLAIVKGLVELMNGEIGVTSQPGKGSRFYFSIPYIPNQESIVPLAERPIVKGDYNFAGKTILIVEDDEINYRFLEIVMHKTKAKVIRAVTGREAIDMSLQHDVSLVLMDIQIPVVDGYVATREIKKGKPELPIVAQTAHALAEERTRCMESGADDYLSKPINRRDLLSKIALLLQD